jgi:CRISPR-associated protein Cmr5
MKTRSQYYSEKVFNHINELDFQVNEADEEKKEKAIKTLKKQYGSLCHSFPLMVLRNGLSQAVAFVWVKSKNDADTPYGIFLRHLSCLTGGYSEEPADFQKRINKAGLIEYQRLTREILTASIWYKRFAESILEVKANDNTEDADNG